MNKAKPNQRHHYLPACYIGLFSWDTRSRRRKQPVYVRRNGISHAFIESAQGVAFQEGLYNLSGSSSWLGEHIDVWDYEGRLPGALAMLDDPSQPPDARSWLDTLVPFIAGLFVRGPDANDGANNEGRIIEFQELIAPVMAANWTVLHAPSNDSLITSDRGYGVLSLSNGGHAVVIPCNPQTALILTYGEWRTVATWVRGSWAVNIQHKEVSAETCAKLRQAVAHRALRDVYGPTQQSVESVAEVSLESDLSLPTFMVNPTICDLVCHVYDYFRMCSALRTSPNQAQSAADQIRWDSLPEKWSIPVAVETVFPERTRGGVRIEGSRVILDLRYGISLARIRRQLEDPMTGGYSVFPVSHLVSRSISLGEHWQSGTAGTSGETTMHLNGARPVQVNLSLLRADIGFQ